MNVRGVLAAWLVIMALVALTLAWSRSTHGIPGADVQPLAEHPSQASATPEPNWRYIWRKVPQQGPARAEHTVVLDTEHDRLVLFGGYQGPGGEGPLVNDVWEGRASLLEYTSLRWSPLVIENPDEAPQPRARHIAVYNGELRQMFVFGGDTGQAELDSSVYILDLQSKESATWTSVVSPDGPLGRVDHAAALVESTGDLVIYGGRRGTQLLDDVWAFDTRAHVWRQVAIGGGGGPGPRFGHTLEAYPGVSAGTPVAGPLFMYGGSGSCGMLQDPLWTLDIDDGRSASWAPADVAAPIGARTNHDTAVWALNLHVYGGRNEAGELAENEPALVLPMHAYLAGDRDAWYAQPTKGDVPSPREGATLTTFPGRPGWMFVVYGGKVGHDPEQIVGDAWLYMSPGDPPPPPRFTPPPATNTPQRTPGASATPLSADCGRTPTTASTPSPTETQTGTPTLLATARTATPTPTKWDVASRVYLPWALVTTSD